MSFIEIQPIVWGQEPPAHLRQIYEEAFPPEERRPWSQLFDQQHCEHVAQLIIYAERVAGFLVSWELPSSHYFEYLVIDPALRGQGLGTKVLQRISQLYDDEYPIVLEAEPAGHGRAKTCLLRALRTKGTALPLSSASLWRGSPLGRPAPIS